MKSQNILLLTNNRNNHRKRIVVDDLPCQNKCARKGIHINEINSRTIRLSNWEKCLIKFDAGTHRIFIYQTDKKSVRMTDQTIHRKSKSISVEMHSNRNYSYAQFVNNSLNPVLCSSIYVSYSWCARASHFHFQRIGHIWCIWTIFDVKNNIQVKRESKTLMTIIIVCECSFIM